MDNIFKDKIKLVEYKYPLTGLANIVIFVCLFLAKISNKIDWSWWWVFSPFWIPIAVLGLIIGILILGYCIYILYNY